MISGIPYTHWLDDFLLSRAGWNQLEPYTIWAVTTTTQTGKKNYYQRSCWRIFFNQQNQCYQGTVDCRVL